MSGNCLTIGMESQSVLDQLKVDMNKALEHLAQEFTSLRTGKASPSLIENLDVHVASYGSVMKLNGLAVISTPEPRMLIVQPFDPTVLGDIDKAIREGKVGLNPVSDGKILRLPIPEPSEERRLEMVKFAKQYGEEAKIRVRAIRKEGMDSAKTLKSNNELTEDGQKDFEKQVQDLTDSYVKQVDEKLATKEQDIMTV